MSLRSRRRPKTPCAKVLPRRNLHLAAPPRVIDETLEQVDRAIPRADVVNARVAPVLRVHHAAASTFDPSRADPKPPAYTRSERFKALVRSKLCINPCCRRGPCDPDHIGKKGLSQKTDDTRCVPVCRVCHIFRTTNGYLPLNGPETPGRHRADPLLVAQLIKRTRLLVAEASVELLHEYMNGTAPA